ncbi:hypothetical protein F5888DRAFT_1639227 [Russula emetica]|nr:hypothetical protein F5888DRAFT_1639227 [Russula emetica]
MTLAENAQPLTGHAQDIPAQIQPNALIHVQDVSSQPNQECDPFGYVPQYVAPDHVQTFPHPFLHRIPTPNQLGAENHRRLANRYLHHPDARVGMVSMEAGAAGRLKVVIILEMPYVFLSGC